MKVNRKITFVSILIITFPLFFYCSSPSQDQKVNGSNQDGALTPEQQLESFKLPEGFIIELVASERDGIINPIDLTFDESGRLWTQTASMYPLDPISDIKWNDLLDLMNDPDAQKNHPEFKRISKLYKGETKGDDKILILSNLFDDSPINVNVWADGLTIPQSILPFKNGAFVAQGSELFLLQDTNNDGKADKRIPYFTGFGFTDTHTMAHTLIRAPGNWIHFSHGALNKGKVTALQSDLKLRIDYSKIARFLTSGTKMEIVNSGLNNIWGYQLRHNGQWYGTEANDFGYSVVPMESGTSFPGIGNEKIRPYQPWLPPFHEFRVGGTGLSGLAFADDLSGSFPEEWKDVAFLANPITGTINSVKITRNSDGSYSSKHLEDLLVSEDPWFRPVNMEFGPDGSLYIADWYNKIVSHNEVPTTHPERDKSHGRIWRIRHVTQKKREIPDFRMMKTEDLVEHLKSPSLWAKRSAWQQISDRLISETTKLSPSLIHLASDSSMDEITRIHALWSLEGINHYDEKLMDDLIQDPMDNLRREAIRSLVTFNLSPAEAANKLMVLIEDSNSLIRSQVLRTLSEIGNAVPETIEILLLACKPELMGSQMGGGYERRFERYLSRKALENYALELEKFLNSPAASKIPTTNKIWATQALPKGKKEQFFLSLWPSASISELDETHFIIVAQMLGNKEIQEMVRPYFSNLNQASNYVSYAIQNQALIQSEILTDLLKKPISHLLNQDSELDKNLGLDAISRFKIRYSNNSLSSLINKNLSEKTLNLLIKALEVDLNANQQYFFQIFQIEDFSFSNRALALNNFSKSNPTEGEKELIKWIPTKDQFEKREIVNLFSGSNQGAEILKKLFETNLLEISTFDKSSAEQIKSYNPSDPIGTKILNTIYEIEESDRKLLNEKILAYKNIVNNNEGSVSKGKVLFETCLMCHKVGNIGYDFAPALDGSANRDLDALLTAILDPDAAVESNYAMYRVTKKDLQNIEGYLVKKEDSGTTIGFMGGNKIFINAEDIKSQGYLGGRSFMNKGLIDNLSEEEIADLFAFIRTLK
ncbi:putative membrane-bound dehydrogenase domain-containing protein [Aquiflexum balticum DSM 16537]|uniref:Putative membrane-bound dehydrogenase domain-containing protein n=1 Tax=Aquiflexum balticum DSM 16537 TaxID=758820 RepID=A0A1W2H888_9BACT|nr:HEAT repeat domain-containing protein [Aquiflexum balticum]SMD44872.1 putative membrane-bound dehydrogenase domain-containing protein [Aquiflexum balticum DSM 16537]